MRAAPPKGIDRMAGFARTLLPLGISALTAAPERTARHHSHQPSLPHGEAPRRFHRTIFISDVHLGTRGCKAEMLADFLSKNTCQTLYLVGDIVDGWQLKRRWFWPEIQERVLHEILKKADEGVRVIYIPGNHDEIFRNYCERRFAGIEVIHEAIHE